MRQDDNTILMVSIGVFMTLGYFFGKKYLDLSWGLGIGLVLGIVIGTVLNFYLNRPKNS